MMKEEELRKLFELPIPELAKELYRRMPVEGKIPEKLLQKYWNKLGEEKQKAVGKAIAVLLDKDALEYAKKYPWKGNPYL